MADEPVSAWREPFSRRARRWARRNRTAVTSLAASVLVALAGTAAVLAVQTQANGRAQAGQHRPVARQRTRQPGKRRSEGGQRTREAAVRPGDGGDQVVPRRGRRRPGAQGRPVQDASRQAAQGCGRLLRQARRPSQGTARPGVARGDGQCVLRAGRADRQDRRQDRGARGPRKKGWRSVAIWPRSRPPTPLARGDVARSLHATAVLLDETGEKAEALARFEEARDLLEGLPVSGAGLRRAPRSARHGLLRIGEAAREYGEGGRGDVGLPAVGRDPDAAGRRQPRRSPTSAAVWRHATTTSAFSSRRPPGRSRRSSRTGMPGRSSRSWPTTIPPSPTSRSSWRAPRTTSAICRRGPAS